MGGKAQQKVKFFKLKNSPYVNFFQFFFVQILDMDGTRLKTAKI